MTTPVTELVGRDLTFVRDDIPILTGVDIVLRGGERVALTGPSGSGKSTLISLLAGLAPPDSGSVILDGDPLTDVGRTLRHRVAVVFQGYALVALLTATENIELPLLAAGLTSAEAAERAGQSLLDVGLADRADHLVEELSGGQQQRLAVARGLATRPDVLMVDEPTTEQDPARHLQTVNAVLQQAERGAAVLVATHDAQVAARCDRWLHLESGVLRVQR
jgi:putative ABC transport system ATP-binding protein